MKRATRQELAPAVSRRYDALRRRYRRESTYRAVVDMYRNLDMADEIAAHFMAAHDVDKYRVRDRFSPVEAGYSPREREFLARRGVQGC